MIIEFIGSTGAGKTILVAEVQRKLSQSTEVVGPFDVITQLLHLPRVSNPTVQNVVMELVGLPFFVVSLYRHRKFLVFALRSLARHKRFTFFTVGYLRSIVRKIGTHELVKRFEGSRVVLVDEGTLLIAHNLFVYTTADFIREDVSEFASSVPLPDVVIYVKAPIEQLVERSVRRANPPRELRTSDTAQIEEYVRRAVNVFDEIVETEEVRDRVLVVENPVSGNHERVAKAEAIAEFILNRRLERGREHERVSKPMSALSWGRKRAW
jgi:hypothetical protein